MQYIVDNNTTYESFSPRLQAIVSSKVYEVLGERVTDRQELLDIVHSLGDLIDVVPTGDIAKEEQQ